jgi:flagellar FliJ protein
MSRPFPLTGLLRLRRLQEDQAAGELAAARKNAAAHSVRQRQARMDLDGTSSEVTDSSSLLAVAAARASARSMLAGLEAMSAEHRAAVEHTRDAFAKARLEAAGLEKLEGRHLETAAAEELRAEQVVLDEIASAARRRKSEEAVLCP